MNKHAHGFARPQISPIFNALSLLCIGALFHCGGPGATDGGTDVSITPQPPIDGAVVDVVQPTDSAPGDGGTCALPANFFTPRPAAFAPTDNVARSVQVSISGESLAETGYDYTAMPAEGEPVFVDGWELRFDHYIVVIGSVQLNQPGADPTMRSSIGGLVARAEGPWIVDLHNRGPLTGAGGPPETATALTVLTQQMNGQPFDPAIRYAFSFATTPATCAMQNVNLSADATGAVNAMLAGGWTKYISGTATYRGRMATAMVDPEFQNYPRVVRFSFGFNDRASYVNCHNPQIGAEDVAANRGVQVSMMGKVSAQITMHTDHSFWDEADVEGTPLHFDPIAARVPDFGMSPMGMSSVSLDDLQGVMPSALTTRTGMPVRNRGTMTMGVTDNSPPPSYSVNSAAGSIRDLREFVIYNTRAQGHLNSDGICFVRPE